MNSAWYVVRQQGADPAAWYREQFTTPARLELPSGAVIGPAECGNRADAELLWPLLTHPAAGVRARAVVGLRTLDCADARRLRPLLDDPAVVVRETAATLLPSVKGTARRLAPGTHRLRAAPARPRRRLPAAPRSGGIVALRAALVLLDDLDTKLRTWAGQSIQHSHPPTDARHHDPEWEELLARSRHFVPWALPGQGPAQPAEDR
ncbi:hypothetical protein ACFU5B_21835 [Streptomyces murinus]|uniref:hypothetical protein n=1 Tax=Streptomyces murinus TaxID=33900 RepID=UPI003636C900